MSNAVDSFDVGGLTIVAGLAWYFDNPGFLIGFGIGIVLKPIFAGSGRKAGRFVNRRLAQSTEKET